MTSDRSDGRDGKEAIKARVFLHSVHASLEHDVAQMMQHLGMTIVRANMNRSYEERPCIPGYTDMDYGDAMRERVNRLQCVASDFEGCDLVFFFNPSDFHQRIEHFSKFKPVVMYLNGQWVEQQLDELASKINGQWDRGETPNMWVAVYTKYEENYLRPRVHTQLQDRIHHIRFGKKISDYAPWTLDGSKAPERKPYIYTTCNDILQRAEACNYKEYQEATRGLKRRLSGRNTDKHGGQGLIAFDKLREQMRECAGYMGVPCWPAPLVLNIVEAMMSGSPVAYFDNKRGIASEGMFDSVGCLSSNTNDLNDFLRRCCEDKPFREDQSYRSLERARELFDFDQQVEKWRTLFSQMEVLWS